MLFMHMSTLWHAGLHSGSIAIIRLSGADAFDMAHKVFRPSAAITRAPSAWQPKSHQIYHGHAVDAHGTALDEVPAEMSVCR